MNRPESEFWSSTLAKVVKMIDIHADKQMIKSSAIAGNEYQSRYFDVKGNKSKQTVIPIRKMSEIGGMRNG